MIAYTTKWRKYHKSCCHSSVFWITTYVVQKGSKARLAALNFARCKKKNTERKEKTRLPPPLYIVCLYADVRLIYVRLYV
jgi:hypothetical protein